MSDPPGPDDRSETPAPAPVSSESIEAMLAASGIEPDLAEVLARARAKDPAALPFALDEMLAAGIDSSAPEEDPRVADELADGAPGLVPYISAYRWFIDEQVDRRLLEPLGVPPRPSVVPLHARRRGRRVAAMVGGVAALAAVTALAAFGGAVATRDPSVEMASEAASLELARRPRSADSLAPREPTVAFIEPIEATDPTRAPVDGPSEHDADHEEPPLPETRPEPRLRGAALEAQLAELDARARRAWRAGELSKAERLFRKIIKMGGRHRLAELAHGDLFSLTAQQKKPLRPVWQAYLRRFPKGRYAEDARAGLCRLAPSSQRDSCWDAYKADFPKGIHAP